MAFILDAWLEQKSPRLRIVDAGSNVVVLDWNESILRPLLDNGELCAKDFNNPCKNEIQRLIRGLFLLACRMEIAALDQQDSTLKSKFWFAMPYHGRPPSKRVTAKILPFKRQFREICP